MYNKLNVFLKLKLNMVLNTLNNLDNNPKNLKLWFLIKSISLKIYELLEYSTEIASSWVKDIGLSDDFIDLFTNLLPKYSDKTFLSNYFTDDDEKTLDKDRLMYKVEKNLMLFLPHIVSSLDNNSNKNKKIIIIEQLRKFLKILLVFWDKINFELLDNLLKSDLIELESIEKTFLENTKSLELYESSLNNKFIGLYNKDKVNENDYLIGIYLPSIYRISLKRSYLSYIENENKSKNKSKSDLVFDEEKINSLLSINLEKEISNTYLELYELFLKTIDSKKDLNNRLKKLKNWFAKLIWYVEILRDTNIAFTDILEDKILFFNRLNLKAFGWKFNNNDDKNLIFLEFLKLWNSEWIDWIIMSIESLKEKQINSIKQLKDNEVDNFDIKKISLGSWKELDINFSNKMFIENLFIIDKNTRNIKLSSEFKFDTIYTKAWKSLIRKFSEASNLSKDIIFNQIDKIEALIKKWINLNDFISQDVNDLQFLYDWWEFILYERFDWNKNKTYSKTISWFANIIISELTEQWIIPSDKIDVSIGRSHNTSSQNIGNWINNSFLWLSRGSINLKEYKIWKRLLKDCKNLYSIWEKSKPGEIKNHILLWINTCIQILEWNYFFKEELSKKYVASLVKYWVLPQNLKDISLKNKDDLIKLMEWLWYIKSKIDILEKMVTIANEDYWTIYKSLESFIENNFNSNDIRTSDWFWPEKNFWRALVKLISKYDWDFHQLWDLNRLRIKKDNVNELKNVFIEFIKVAKESNEIINVSIEDWTWNPISLPQKDSWYRDLKVQFTLLSWNTVEFQFHFSDMLETKSAWIVLDEKIKSKLSLENSLLNKWELAIFAENFYSIKKKSVSLNTLSNISWLGLIEITSSIKNKDHFSENWCNVVNSDLLYDIRRNLDKNSILAKKLVRLERILFDNSWTKSVKHYLTSIWIDWLKWKISE